VAASGHLNISDPSVTNWAFAESSTAYHPQTNGLVERNEVVKLRHYVSPDQNDWHKHLPFIEFALNNAYHKTIHATPPDEQDHPATQSIEAVVGRLNPSLTTTKQGHTYRYWCQNSHTGPG
jgi:hypothetical protein